MLRALAIRMTRDLLPAPKVPRPERFSLRAFNNLMLPALVALHNRANEDASPWTDDEVRERLDDPAASHGLFLGTDRLGAAGYCWVTTAGIEAEVTSFGIDERAAGTGLAASLVARGLQWAEIQGAYTAIVHVGEKDHKAARLFRRLGFMIEPDRPS